jgi:hypothetical protein
MSHIPILKGISGLTDNPKSLETLPSGIPNIAILQHRPNAIVCIRYLGRLSRALPSLGQRLQNESIGRSEDQNLPDKARHTRSFISEA